MRFFFEFVSCCGQPPVTERESSAPRLEETSSLVPTVRYNHRRKRGRAASDWRPSLGSISEDNAPLQNQISRNGVVRSEREAQRKSAAAAKIRQRNYDDDYRRQPMSMFPAAFSPTPFLF